MRNELIKLREEIKTLSSKIRIDKLNYKDVQRVYSKFTKENPICNSYHSQSVRSVEWAELRPKYNEISKEQFESWINLSSERELPREMHVAYSMLRGRTIEQIEPKVRKGNELDMHAVEEIIKQYSQELLNKEIA